MTGSWLNDSLMELWRPDSWLTDREYERHLAGVDPCDHGWLPTDPDATCECWDAP